MSFHTESGSGRIEAGGTRRSRSNTRLLIVFLAGSVAVHAAALVALPGFLPDDRDTTPVQVLEAALVQAESPPQVAEVAPAPPLPPRRPPERTAKTPLITESPRMAEVPPPVRAWPEPSTQAEPSFTVPAPRPAETPAGPAPPRTEVASIAMTPPSFGAAYLRNPAPAYPLAAKRSNLQGTVTLRVLVTREGLPARVELEKSSGSPQLDQAALETVRTWRFAPARRGAEPVEDTVIVPVVFRLERASS